MSSEKLQSCAVVSLVVVFIVIFLTVIIGSIVGSSNDKSQKNNIATNFYSPGDSRLVSLSSFFCDGGVLELTSNTVDAELYRVDSVPPLNDTNNFTINFESSIYSSRFRFWQYHLYPNSNIMISLCANLVASVYIVKGNDNANSWAKSPSRDVAELFRYVGACCPNKLDFAPKITYRVEQEDEYYVILHNSLSAEVFVNVSVSFERTEYSAPDVESSCDVSERGQCSLSIPYGTGSQSFLVITSIPQTVDWEENISVSVNCDQRGWAYALVVLLPIAVIVGIVLTIVLSIVIVCFCKCKKPCKSRTDIIDSSDFDPDPPPKN